MIRAAKMEQRLAVTARSIPARLLVAALIALFAVDNILLLAFLGLGAAATGLLLVMLPPALALMAVRTMPAHLRVDVRTVLLCAMVSCVLLLLGGEGRLFYATADWQIRDAVLADMGRHRWPFDYLVDGNPSILRAPLGLYLVPSLLGGASQIGRDWALLAHNSVILGLMLSVGSILFDGVRARFVALIMFFGFSGLDVMGSLVIQSATGWADWWHLERWADNYQYSAHITQIFWVPHHALAGWFAALAYMLWRRGMAGIGLFAAGLPLVAIWSPLVLFGALPFALLAGGQALMTGRWSWRDVAFALLALFVAAPDLIYLSSDAAALGGALRPPPRLLYCLVILLEVLPFILPQLLDRHEESDRMTIGLALACLLVMPVWIIGANNDFQMRASIMPLVIVAVGFAQWAVRLTRPGEKVACLLLISLGAVTGTVEIANALRFRPTPAPHCSLLSIWHRQSGLIAPYGTYFAARDRMPVALHPVERVDSVATSPCWERRWQILRARP